MFSIMPKKSVFFELFRKSAQNVHNAARLFAELLDDYQDVPNKVQQIKNLEHEGDEFTHRIFEYLAKTFITPLDREDIHKAATRLDDIIDEINNAATRLLLFKITQVADDAKAFAKCLVTATGLLIEAFDHLQNLKKPDAIMNCCVQVHTQENEGDRLMHHALAGLFEGPNPDPLEILKWKDVYQILEKATDRCEDVADVLQTIVVKHG